MFNQVLPDFLKMLQPSDPLMKSQAFTEYGQPLQEVVTDTPVPMGTEVLVKINYCGVCHSDLHIHDGYFDFGGGKHLDVKGARQLPFTLGHEIEGEVVALGSDAKGVSIGARKAVYPWIGCGSCSACGRGDEHLCNRHRHLGITANGGFATHLLLPHPRYLFDYSGVEASIAGTYMCSGLTAYSAIKKTGLMGSSEPLLIVGLGGVGMMALQFARVMLNMPPLAADIDEAKLAAAKQAGAQIYQPKDAASAKQLIKDTDGGVLAAIDFVGSEASLAFAMGAVRKGGRVLVVGMMGGALSMPIPLFPMRSIGIDGSFVGSLAETQEMLELVKTGKIAPIPIEERPLEAASRSLDDLRAGRIIGRVVLKV